MHINKVGFEIEGGWDGEERVSPFSDLVLVDDHSIDGRMQASDRRLTTTHIGEAISPPMSPDPLVWRSWLQEHWPTDSNLTCGYHIHISLNSLKDYSFLTHKSFLYEVQRVLWKAALGLKLPPKHYIWNRLSGVNQFAQYSTDTTRQIGIRAKRVADPVRYGFLNYCYHLHKTLEFRALPTFETAALAIAFTQIYFDTVESYLDNLSNTVVSRKVALKYGPTGHKKIVLA